LITRKFLYQQWIGNHFNKRYFRDPKPFYEVIIEQYRGCW